MTNEIDTDSLSKTCLDVDDGGFACIKQAWEVLVKNNECNEVKALEEVAWHAMSDSSFPLDGSIGDTVELLRNKVYSPMQFVLWKSIEKTKARSEYEYPFMFGAVGYCIALILKASSRLQTEESVEMNNVDDQAKKYAKVLQSLFYLRELHEESQHLSLEVHIPFKGEEERPGAEEDGVESEEADPDLPISKLAQVFGRGIAVTRDEHIVDFLDPRGRPWLVFKDHSAAPQTLLYSLGRPYQNVDEGNVCIVLRRDGHLTVSYGSNPLIEFYHGGWHVVDYHAGEMVLTALLDKKFSSVYESEVPQAVLPLAYHLATHWHGAIIAIIDSYEGANESKFEEDHEVIKNLNTIVKEALCDFDHKLLLGKNPTIVENGRDGHGRLLLASAIHDGAIVIDKNGTIHGIGKMVKADGGKVKGGARTHAAKTLAKVGVIMKISQDGGINIYSDVKDGNDVEVSIGLRIH